MQQCVTTAPSWPDSLHVPAGDSRVMVINKPRYTVSYLELDCLAAVRSDHRDRVLADAIAGATYNPLSIGLTEANELEYATAAEIPEMPGYKSR